MKKHFVLAVSVMFGVFMFFTVAGYALAGEDMMAKGESCPLDWSMTRPAQFSGYIGALVLDRDNHELGRIVDVTSGPDDAVNFFIIYSCLPGMSDKLIAFPVRQFNTQQRIETVVINTTQQEFQGAPTIESKMWPAQMTSSWAGEFYHYFENTF